MARTLEDFYIVLDNAYYEWHTILSNGQFIIVNYFIFEIFRAGEDSQFFRSPQVTEDTGFSRTAQTKALEVAVENGLLEVEVAISKGKNIKLGKVIMELLNG